MATPFWKARDFLFYGVCGTLLDFDNIRYASCPLCGFKRMAKDIEGKETRYSITAEDMRRELKIQPFVDVAVQKTVIDSTCPKCKHDKLEYDQRGSYGLRMKGRLPSMNARNAATDSMRTKKQVSCQFMDAVRRNYSLHEPGIDVQASCSFFACILIMNVIIWDMLIHDLDVVTVFY